MEMVTVQMENRLMDLQINLPDINITTIVMYISIIVSYFKLSDNLGYMGKLGSFLKKILFFRTK